MKNLYEDYQNKFYKQKRNKKNLNPWQSAQETKEGRHKLSNYQKKYKWKQWANIFHSLAWQQGMALIFKKLPVKTLYKRKLKQRDANDLKWQGIHTLQK